MVSPISADDVLRLVERLANGEYGVASELRDALEALRIVEDDAFFSREVLGAAYLTLYTSDQRPDDLESAIDTLGPVPAAIGLRLSAQTNLALALLQRSRLTADGVDAAAARTLLLEIAQRTPHDDPKRVLRCAALLEAELACYERGDPSSLDQSISAGELALDGAPVGTRLAYLAAELGSALRVRGLRTASAYDLDKAVGYLQQACAATHDSDPNVARRLSNLAAAFHERFVIEGNLPDVDQAIDVQLQATLLARGEFEQASIANNLANFYLGRYMALGRKADLERSSELRATQVEPLRQDQNFHSSHALNAGLSERARFNLTGDPELLDQATAHYRLALALGLPTPFDEARALDSLAVALRDHYQISGELALLEEAIEHGRAAVRKMPGGHPERAQSLSNLASALRDRYLRHGRLVDLDEAAAAHAEALAQLPSGHWQRPPMLNNAAIVLTARYRRAGLRTDLDNAVAFLTQCLSQTPEDHSDLAPRLINLTAACLDRFELNQAPADLDAAEALVRRAMSTPSAPHVRTSAEIMLADVLMKRFDHAGDRRFIEEVVETGRRTLSSKTRPLSRAADLLRLAVALDLRSLPSDRAEAAELYQAACTDAVDIRPDVTIMAARGWAWWALRQSREDHGALRAVYDATEIGLRAVNQVADLHTAWAQQLSWRKEALGLAAARAHAFVLDGDTRQAVTSLEEGRAVILRRLLPEFAISSPILPSQAAGAGDTVQVLLWSTPIGGGALLIDPDGTPKAVPLSGLRDHDVDAQARHLSFAYRKGADAFEAALATVLPWLGEQISPVSARIPPGTRVVLIPTGRLGSLPWIAALVGGAGGGAPRHWLEMGDITISPTLGMAQWAATIAAAHGPIDFATALSVANPRPSQHQDLPFARIEADAFSRYDRILTEQNATKAKLLSVISDSSIVHIACHCRSARDDPLASHVLLANDEPLYAEELLALPPLRARLAVLSGCETALVGHDHADEVLGLATAFMGRGVPGVIATLWPVRDVAAAALMIDVATRLKRGESPSSALLDAQRDALGENHNPRLIASWAGFSFIGA